MRRKSITQQQIGTLGIVVLAYNRDKAFDNLLKSLKKIRTNRNDIDLIISLENGFTHNVELISENFIWNYGKKIIVRHERKLGLRNHFIWAGDQTKKYDCVLFLEDDLYVSPEIIDVVGQMISKYQDDVRVAGISLYSPLICEFNSCRFYPLEDGYDNYFFQHPYWGNVWFKKQWSSFKKWFNGYKENNSILPKFVRLWNNTSFKKVFIQFLIETHKYMVFPRVSLVNNEGFVGIHSKSKAKTFQVPLQFLPKALSLSTLEESNSIYDAFFEISATVLNRFLPNLQKYDYNVDLSGNRDFFDKQYVLSVNSVFNSLYSWSKYSKPTELGLILHKEGEGVFFTETKNIKKILSDRDKWFYDLQKNNIMSRRFLVNLILEIRFFIIKSF